MTAVCGPWSRVELAAFLDEATVPRRLAARTPSDRQWRVPLRATARLAEIVEHDPRVAFDVSTNEIPSRGVSGKGGATIRPDEGKELLRDLLDRYLGGKKSSLVD